MGVIVDEPPTEATITDSDELNLTELAVLRTVLDMAADPDTEKGTATYCESTYEFVEYYNGSPDERREVADALDELPIYEPEVFCDPVGFYIRHEEHVIAIFYFVNPDV